ncbi:MAG TPA: GAF and ANTAR domain-containing protein [Blastococcus sp.]
MTLRDHALEPLLRTVAELSKSALPGACEASISLVAGEGPSTLVFTGRLAIDCDHHQYEHGEGPCLHAAKTGELVQIDDMRAETRWHDYVREAAERGAGSSLSTPLLGGEPLSGALNVYARQPHAFHERSRAVAMRLAPYAAVTIARMSACQAARDTADNLADNLEAALQSRAVIDQAKGILMERHKLSADRAFEVLAQASMRTNTKLRDVADRLVNTGELLRC